MEMNQFQGNILEPSDYQDFEAGNKNHFEHNYCWSSLNFTDKTLTEEIKHVLRTNGET